jgi:hypothetical protein
MNRLLPCLALLSLAACSQSEASGFSSITVNLAQLSGAKLAECEAAFARGSAEIFPADDGSEWLWVKDVDGTLSHYCRTQKSGAVTAWGEARGEAKATHGLTFSSNGRSAVFGPIAH